FQSQSKKISELRMEILDKKSNRMSRANSGVFECNEFPDLQRILDFLSLRNLLSNELFFTFCEFATASFLFFRHMFKFMY
ncbi:hypothetical protein FUSPEROL_02529, partial [Fusobacterium periodonticum ATCC 33693]